jgi:hypothetical protein
MTCIHDSSGPAEQPGGVGVVAGDEAEAQADRRAAVDREPVDVVLGDDDRLRGAGDVDGAVLVDPAVPVVGVDEAQALLDDPLDPRAVGGVGDDPGPVETDAVDRLERSGPQGGRADGDLGGEVGDGVAPLHPRGQVGPVVQVAGPRLRAHGRDQLGGPRGPRQSDHVVAGSVQGFDGRSAHHSTRTREEDLHVSLPGGFPRQLLPELLRRDRWILSEITKR